MKYIIMLGFLLSGCAGGFSPLNKYPVYKNNTFEQMLKNPNWKDPYNDLNHHS